MKTLTYLLLLFTFASCSYHQGMISAGSGSVTNQAFSNVDYAFGSEQTTHVFGIGGNHKDALVLEAKRNLYLNFKPSATQVIGQTTVDIKRTFFFPVFVTKVTVSAEIIDFSEGRIDSVKSQSNRQAFINAENAGTFEFGQQVLYRKKDQVYSATVLGFEKEKYIIKYFDKRNNFKIKRLDYSVLEALTSIEPKDETTEAESLFTPKNLNGVGIRFKYKSKEYTGELVKRSLDSYLILILMEKSDGEKVGLYIPAKDIIE